MRCDVLTLFPAAVEPYLAVGVLGRAAAAGVLEVRVHDLRKWAINSYGQVDDEPYGGGPGMVLMAPAVIPAVRDVRALASEPHVVLPDARGRRFDDAVARELAGYDRLLFVCGRYEGFDERVHEVLRADEISLGDFVLSGGELAALVMLDAAARHLPGVVGDPGSVAAGLLHIAAARPPGFHPASRVRRPDRPRCPDLGRPRGGAALATRGGGAPDPAPQAGPDRRRLAFPAPRNKDGDCGGGRRGGDCPPPGVPVDPPGPFPARVRPCTIPVPRHVRVQRGQGGVCTMDLREIEKGQMRTDRPEFGPGDTVRVHVKVREGEKERIRCSRAW